MAQKPAEKPPLIRGMLVDVKKDLGKDERRMRDLVEGIARDTAKLHMHTKENAQALADRSHPEYYFAQSGAAAITGRIGASLRKAIPLRGRGNAAISNMIDHYTAAAAQHERNAKKSKPEGYASIGYQGMAKVVEENRKRFDIRVLRNRALADASDLKDKLSNTGKADPQLVAKLHNGIVNSLFDAASYTNYLQDGGRGHVPALDKILGEADAHNREFKRLNGLILQKLQKKKMLNEAKKQANEGRRTGPEPMIVRQLRAAAKRKGTTLEQQLAEKHGAVAKDARELEKQLELRSKTATPERQAAIHNEIAGMLDLAGNLAAELKRREIPYKDGRDYAQSAGLHRQMARELRQNK